MFIFFLLLPQSSLKKTKKFFFFLIKRKEIVGKKNMENSNAECVGPTSENAGKASSCAGCPNQSLCASGEMKKPNPAQEGVNATFSQIKHTVLVLSGKGGVGKSTFSTQLAFGLARRGLKVGLLDVDICGPSIPFLCGVKGQEVHQSASGWSPVYVDVETDGEDAELGVMSIGFLMPDQDSAVIWRGPRKTGLIQQFFTSVDWGQLDYLVVDTPPGTSDEHISIVQLLKQSLKPTDGAIVITTPQEVAMMDVRKELSFCKQTGLNVLGVVENMSRMEIPFSALHFMNGSKEETIQVLEMIKKLCPHLLDMKVGIDVFPSSATSMDSPESMAKRFDCPFLGKIPLDPKLQQACEDGEPAKALKGSAAGGPLNAIIDKVIQSTNNSST